MARTRRRYRSGFKRRRLSRRNFMRKRTRRSRYGKKRTFRRRNFTKRRRTGMRRTRRRFGRGTTFKSPGNHSKQKFLTLKSANRCMGYNLFDLAKAAGTEIPSIAQSVFYDFKNTLGYFGCTQLPDLVEKPDIFPPTGHSGMFLVLSLDTYIHAMAGSFFGFRYSRVLGNYAPTAYGTKGLMSENELALRKNMLEHNRVNLYKIGVRFKRRVGRSTNNSTILSGQVLNPLVSNGPQTSTNFGSVVTGHGVLGVNKIVTEPDRTNLVYVPNTSGELPFYSQTVDYLTNGWQLSERLRVGFPTNNNDPIPGNDSIAVKARYSRLLNEMSSGREWKKHSGSKSLNFSIGKKKNTGDFLRVNYSATGVMNAISVGDASNLATGSSYTVASDLKNFPSGTNSFESFCATIQEKALFYNGDAVNICTLPAIDGPRGSIVIWIPYTDEMFNSMYDVEVYGKYRFSDGSMSSIDMPMFVADTDVVMV